MKVLVIGGGGREHAIVWKLSQSKKISKIYCAPGNAGIEELAECVNIKATDIEALVDFAYNEQINFTIVGMDDPLMLGVVDKFEEKGLKIFGPNKKAALIEGSKAFAKELMKKYNIPTANYEVFTDYKAAIEYANNQKLPIVVKADGLALGKGVIICNTYKEAEEAIYEIMENKKFGEAGNKIVIEEFLTGHEVSVLSFCDGDTIIPMVSAQDHKRALDNDKGLNTGGMGTFSPSRIYTKEINDYCMEKIFKPTLKAMKEEGRPFTGILFFGLMITEDGVKVLEYNARFGDPEAQVVLPRLKGDLLEILEACVDKRLHEVKVEWEDNAAVCVILASGGYPLSYKKGYPIKGLDKFKDSKDIIVFHAGTAKKEDEIVTNGGRVLGVTGIAKTLDEAIKIAYKGVEDINFEKMHYRRDIGIK
ncbi:phosphoribosylamine--glycine ligase [Defluviitalea phaphyphila]|uniref:phosphoribosylamine--glycine ligase n=1 Tax=Defluviitalea phaphyphila TaxID=1473580 RepID=UPI000730BFDB|nr:phosphoribosylamine--glycine ligase [Defluviitalea phaphyphila]